MTRHDEDGDLAGNTPADTLGPDAALIARLRNPGNGDDFDLAVLDDAADLIEDLRDSSQRWYLAYQERAAGEDTELEQAQSERDEARREAQAHLAGNFTATQALNAAEARLARAEECIEQVRTLGGVPIDQAWQRWREVITAYDAAKEASDG